MNVERPVRTALLPLLALLTVPALHGQQHAAQPRLVPGTGANPTRREAVRLAPAAPPGRSISTITGQPVRDSRNQPLGTLKEVLIDVHSGRVTYALISGDDNALRLAPFGAVEFNSGDAVTLRIARNSWEQTQPIRPDRFEGGRLMLSASDRAMLTQQFGEPEPAPAATSSPLPAGNQPTAAAVGSGSKLLPLRELSGRRISTGTENVGTISDVMIDPADPGTGAAVVTPEPDFAPAGRKLLVPLRQLNLAARDLDPVTTRLKRADFENAVR